MNLIDILQNATKTDAEQYSQFCTVTAVDGNTCTVEPLNGDAPINKVKLIAGESENGVVLVPAVDSVVLVTFTSKSRAFVSMCSTVETVTIRGEQHGGVVIAPELKSQLDKMTARIDGIIDALKNGVTIPNDGGASYKSTIGVSLDAITDVESFDEIENDNVKHG